MPVDPEKVLIYHITNVANLPSIMAGGGLKCDCAMNDIPHTPIGYAHIKMRRMTEITVPCRGNRYVGEFVPFYYCPRSPMLYVVNKGSSGQQVGCQSRILHLVSTLATALAQGRDWAISDGNAGAGYASFYADVEAGFAAIDWTAVRARDWQGKATQKSAEFLVADSFAWSGIHAIGCHDSGVADEVQRLLIGQAHRPTVHVRPDWYY